MVVYDTSEQWNVSDVNKNMCCLHCDNSDDLELTKWLVYQKRALDASSDCLLNRRRHNKESFTTGSSYFDTSVIDQGSGSGWHLHMLTNSNGEVQKGGPWQCHHGWAQVLIKYIDYDKCVPVPGNQKGLVSEFHRDLMAKCPLHFSPGRDVWSCLIRSDLSKSSRGQASSVQNMKLFPPKANTPKQGNLHESTNTNTNTDAGSKFCDWNIIFWHICYRLGGGVWANDDYVRRRGAGGHLQMLTNNSGGVDGSLLTMPPWLSSWILNDNQPNGLAWS